MLGVECPSVDTSLRRAIGLPCHRGQHIRGGRFEVRVQPLMLFSDSLGCRCVVVACQQLEDGPWCCHCLGPASPAGSCGNDGGLNLRVVGWGSILKLPCVFPERRVTLRLLGASRRTAGIVAREAGLTCCGVRWWAWFLFRGLFGRGCL